VAKASSVVEVNGNRYDALTGQLLGTPKAIKSAVSTSGKKMIDGFVVGPHHSSKSKERAAKRTPKAGSLHQGQQRTRTLMRKAVKKPVDAITIPAKSVLRRPKTHDPTRELRAKTISRHAKVSRYGLVHRKAQVTKPAPTKVVAASAASAEIVNPRVPSMVTSVSHRKLERLLDEALVRADAHKQMMNARKHSYRFKRLPKWALITFGGIILAIIVAIIVWQTLPSVAVRVAADRAHVSASMPSYTPAGFTFAKPLQYDPGTVTIQYVNKADSAQSYSVTQKNSNWDDSTLQSNYLPANAPVQTSNVDGTTVYVYGENGDAAWVNHGVLYSLKNKANLPSDQVFKIVKSFN